MSVNRSAPRSGDFATSRRGSLDAYEVDFINVKVAAGCSDSTIANMLRRSLADVVACRETVGILPVKRSEYISPHARQRPPMPPVKYHGSIIRQPRPIPDRAKKIIRETCDQYGLTWSEMVGDSKLRTITRPRQHAYWRLWTAGFAYIAIGGFFGGRDHGTIISGVKAHQARVGDLADAA